MTGTLKCVMVSVDGSEESMNALKWALDNVKLKKSNDQESEEQGSFVILHVQSPPSIAAGLNPAAIPFGGPSDIEVPAFTAAIEAHQKRITQAILDHAIELCANNNVNVKTQVLIGDPKEKICDAVEDMHADLLVMGSRAFGPIKRCMSDLPKVMHFWRIRHGHNNIVEGSEQLRSYLIDWVDM